MLIEGHQINIEHVVDIEIEYAKYFFPPKSRVMNTIHALEIVSM